jgi:hypothetical protein
MFRANNLRFPKKNTARVRIVTRARKASLTRATSEEKTGFEAAPRALSNGLVGQPLRRDLRRRTLRVCPYEIAPIRDRFFIRGYFAFARRAPASCPFASAECRSKRFSGRRALAGFVTIACQCPMEPP